MQDAFNDKVRNNRHLSKSLYLSTSIDCHICRAHRHNDHVAEPCGSEPTKGINGSNPSPQGTEEFFSVDSGFIDRFFNRDAWCISDFGIWHFVESLEEVGPGGVARFNIANDG